MNDPINAPSHYIEGRSFEPLDVINDWELGFCLGNALKYISRAGRKDDALADLKKAAFYINREISYLEERQTPNSDGAIPLSVLGGSDEEIPFDGSVFSVSSYAEDMRIYAELQQAEPQDLAPSEYEPDSALDYWNESPERQDFLFEFDR